MISSLSRLRGLKDLQKIQEILGDSAKESADRRLQDYKVLKARDYKADTIKDMQTGEVTATGLPASNVLVL